MVEVVSNRIRADKTEVDVGEAVNFTGTVVLDQPVTSAELYVEIYVNDFVKPVKSITENISGGSATYSFSLVFQEPGTYRVKTLADIRYIAPGVLVAVPGSVGDTVFIDRAGDKMVYIDPVTGDYREQDYVVIDYIVYVYPDREICSNIVVENNVTVIRRQPVCAYPDTPARIYLFPRNLRPGTLRVEAEPEDPSVKGYSHEWGIIDISDITASITKNDDTEIVVSVTGLPSLPSGLWYDVEVGKTDPDLGLILLGHATTTGGSLTLRIRRAENQGCICANTVLVRLCSQDWYPATCKPLLREIHLDTVCIGPLCG